ncbi:MAG: nitroreductase family protein [Pseudomonadota bacterium]
MDADPNPETDSAAAGLLARLAARRSCRDFDGSAMARETLEAILADAVEAPSSCNHQNWHFVVVTDPDRRQQAATIAGGNPHFETCSALIYLCFQKGWTHGNFSIVQSVAGAAYHMLLSAHLRGYAGIWNAGIGPHRPLRALLGLPEIMELQGAIALGRAAVSAPRAKAPRRPLSDVVSWERFSRPAHALYPARPARRYPFWAIRNEKNPFAEWDPQRWSWAQIADFRGLAVWAKSPLAGVYVSRRDAGATDATLSLLPALSPEARILDVMPWGGTGTAALLGRAGRIAVAELSDRNLAFIVERLAREGAAPGQIEPLCMEGPRLPLADQSIDGAVCLQALEHCPDPERLLDEIARVVRPGAPVVIAARMLISRYGWRWWTRESRGQIPNQGPFRPLLAHRLRRWVGARFVIERDIGIGRGAEGDAEGLTGPARRTGRVYALLARRSG